MVFLELVAGVCVAGLLVVVFILFRSDADLKLLFKEKYGKSPETLAGQVVWITGASSGIGEFTASRLAKAGCRLVLSARRELELERVKTACVRASEGKLSVYDVLVLPLDSVQFNTHKNAVLQVLNHFGRIDILVNNAGRAQRAPWMEIELNVDKELFETNVLGAVSLTQEVLKHMIEHKKGHIVVVSSIVGKIGLPHSRSYTGSKFALHGYFECLRTEMAEHNIDVTMICPGPVFSNVFLHAAMGKPGESVGRHMDKTENRVQTDRCADLIAVAVANKLYEVWITQHPWLLLMYFTQFLPDAGRWYLIKSGVKQVMKMRDAR